jgi:hypothetical protein
MELNNNITIDSKIREFIVWLFLLIVFAYWNKHRKKKPPVINYKEDIDANWDSFGMVRKLTPEQVRSQPGYENLSDEIVHEKIETLYKLSLIGYNVFKNGDDQGFYFE